MSIILIGYRGSGKTTTGRILAGRLNLEFVDTDELIVERAGKSIRDIFAESGEAGFRDLEERAVIDIAQRNDCVIALGGGALNRASNRAAIVSARHKVVYLCCEATELHRRIHSDPTTAASRPNLTPLAGSIQEIEQLLAEREPIWLNLLHKQIDVTALAPNAVAQQICEWMQ